MANAVNWGSEVVGRQAPEDDAGAGEVMTSAGLEPMPDDVAIRALPMVMGSEAPVRSTVVAADWPLLAAAYRTRGALRILDEVLERQASAQSAAPESEFQKALRDCPPEGRRQLLADHIAASASAVMGLSANERLDPTAGFFQLGMDSLMSVTLQRNLSASLGIDLPAACIYENPTISSLTEALCERMGCEAEPTAKSGIATRAQQRAKARQESCRGQTKRTCGVSAESSYSSESDGLGPNAIAVIGMAADLPAPTLSGAVLENLRAGKEIHRDAVRGDPHRRGSQRQDTGRSDVCAARTLLNGIDQFDADYFGINPYTARMMDPQQRLFLQTAWHALEDSGYDPDDYDGSIASSPAAPPAAI